MSAASYRTSAIRETTASCARVHIPPDIAVSMIHCEWRRMRHIVVPGGNSMASILMPIEGPRQGRCPMVTSGGQTSPSGRLNQAILTALLEITLHIQNWTMPFRSAFMFLCCNSFTANAPMLRVSTCLIKHIFLRRIHAIVCETCPKFRYSVVPAVAIQRILKY